MCLEGCLEGCLEVNVVYIHVLRVNIGVHMVDEGVIKDKGCIKGA